MSSDNRKSPVIYEMFHMLKHYQTIIWYSSLHMEEQQD